MKITLRKKILCISFIIMNFIFSSSISNAQTNSSSIEFLVIGEGSSLEDAIENSKINSLKIFLNAVNVDQYISYGKKEPFTDFKIENCDTLSLINKITTIKIYKLENEKISVINKINILIGKFEKNNSIKIKSSISLLKKIIDEQSEINIISELVGSLHMIFMNSFYIKSLNEKSFYDRTEKYTTRFEASREFYIITNEKIDYAANYLTDILSILNNKPGINKEKTYFPIEVNHKGINRKYFLLRSKSIELLSTLEKSWNYFNKQFTLKYVLINNDEEVVNRFSYQIIGKNLFNYDLGKTLYFPKEIIEKKGKIDENSSITINFLTSGDTSNIDYLNITKYICGECKFDKFEVIKNENLCEFSHGGYQLYSDNFVFSLLNFNKYDESIENNYRFRLLNYRDDWFNPSETEIQYISNDDWNYEVRCGESIFSLFNKYPPFNEYNESRSEYNNRVYNWTIRKYNENRNSDDFKE